MFESVDKAKSLLEKGEIQKAFAMFKMLAEKGDAEAQYNLAHMYVSRSKGVSKSFGDHDAEHEFWLEKAAAQGHKDAQADLAREKKNAWFYNSVAKSIAEKAERERQEAAAQVEREEQAVEEKFHKGVLHHEKGEYEKAVALWIDVTKSRGKPKDRRLRRIIWGFTTCGVTAERQISPKPKSGLCLRAIKAVRMPHKCWIRLSR
jgi:lipopolysaccharide biosynthesis regulator YciM